MPGDTRLSVIAEDGYVQPVPPIPPKAANRPLGRRFHLGDPPRHSFEKSPPPYSVWTNVTGPKGERLVDVRNNKFVARRGGWKRLCVVALVVTALLAGLIVGLVLGLRGKHSNDSSGPSPAASSSATPTPNAPFPAGSYTLTTFLDTVSTNCTSNAATWRCYPYTTYSQSSTAALATFNWVITLADSKSSASSNYTISSTDNPFAVDFSNVSMHLVDAGLSSERYTFSVPIKKTVIPSAAITTDNSMARCFYNDTTFRSDLYTRMSGSYPSPASASSSAATSSTTAGSGNGASQGFQPWPYAIRVEETIEGGTNVPACYKTLNGNLGDRITDGITAEAQKNMCSCLYKNWDP